MINKSFFAKGSEGINAAVWGIMRTIFFLRTFQPRPPHANKVFFFFVF